MIANLITAAMGQRWLVLVLAAAFLVFGAYVVPQQSIDAYPDISAEMVQVIAFHPGRAPEEVEQQVAIPLENALRTVPRVESIRSRTIFGLSVVQLIFEEGTESYWARHRVLEAMAEAELPEEAEVELGPLATAYGEIFRYELVSDGTVDGMELRTLNDWVVVPALTRARGVAEVSNFGGLAKQYGVTYVPTQLERFALTLDDLVEAVQTSTASAGGNYLPRGSMSFVIRGRGALQDLQQLDRTFIQSIGGTPVYLGDVATVGLDHAPRAGIFSKDWVDDTVQGIVLMRRGENAARTLANVNAAVEQLNRSALLPHGVQVVPFYDRTELIDSTLETVSQSIALGITLLVLVLLLFLGRPSVALLVALTIPFSLLFALVMMYLTDVPLGLLSLGAVDFGIIVDGGVIVAENIARRLHEARRRGSSPSVRKTILAAVLEVERPVYFAILIIIVAYLPLVTLTSIEGLLFRPMALTMIYALIGALVFSLFLIPVLATFLFRRGYTEWHNPVLAWFRPVYAGILRFLLASRAMVVAGVLAVLALVGTQLLPRLGIEFLPHMDEGVIWVRANFPEGTSLEQTAVFGREIREVVLGFEDVQFIVVQAGRNDMGDDPFPPSRMEIMIGPKPRALWQHFATKQQLVDSLGDALRDLFPTTRFNFTQPIIDSVTEDTNGTSANLAVEFAGVDLLTLQPLAERMVEILRQIPGAQDVNLEQEGPQPQLVIQPDRALCARYNVRIEDVTKLINTALGGEPVAEMFEDQRRFDIVVKVDRQLLQSPQAIGRLPVYSLDGIAVPLKQVALIEVADGQTIITRENGRRVLTVRCDIVGRDQGSFVQEAQRQFERQLAGVMPAGYEVSWLGMFENLDRAYRHFLILIPTTIGLIFVLLLVTFRSFRAAFLVLIGIPFAIVGSVIALWLRDMHINVSTGVGFAALFGIAIMDGVLMVRAITVLREEGKALHPAIIQGALLRLRPILMTTLVAMFGLLPASLATGLGSDVQRPLATVIVWGLFSASMLTLFVVPVLYSLFPPIVVAVGRPGRPDSAETPGG